MPPDDGGVPYVRAYPLLRHPLFAATTRGWRDDAEVAALLGLSERGWKGFERRCGPKWLRKSEGEVPRGAYTDRAVAIWIRDVSMTELAWLAFNQHRWPSASLKDEAEGARLALIEAERLWKE